MSGTPSWSALALNIGVTFLAVLVLMLGTFAVGRAKGRHRVVDISWGLGFTVVAALTYVLSSGEGDGARRLLVLVLTAAWGLRLSGHIAARSWGKGEDDRYRDLLDRAPGSRDFYALRMVYLLQAALISLVSLPIQLAAYLPGSLGPAAFAGVAVWALGLTFETVGDHQLHRFKADSANRGRIMDQGLWRYTRHPNYFGDFCVTWGLFLLACDNWSAVLVLPGPLVMSYLLIWGSGKRLLEKQMESRPGYQSYMERTSGFLPLPPRRADPG